MDCPESPYISQDQNWTPENRINKWTVLHSLLSTNTDTWNRRNETVWKRTRPRVPVQNQQTRELINKDLRVAYGNSLPGIRVNTRYLNSTRGRLRPFLWGALIKSLVCWFGERNCSLSAGRETRQTTRVTWTPTGLTRTVSTTATNMVNSNGPTSEQTTRRSP